MTEQEAKTKWCPFARVVPSSGGDKEGDPFKVQAGVPAHNRVQINGTTKVGTSPAGMCIGSVCMAWRWLGHRDRRDHKTIERFTDISTGANDQDLEAVGFCGLAGKP